MLKLPKPAAIAIQATLKVALSAPSAVPALGAYAAPGNTATESQIKSVQGQLGNFHVAEWGIRRVSVCRLPHCHDGWAGHATPRMTQIHKQLGRRDLPNQASVARVVSSLG